CTHIIIIGATKIEIDMQSGSEPYIIIITSIDNAVAREDNIFEHIGSLLAIECISRQLYFYTQMPNICYLVYACFVIENTPSDFIGDCIGVAMGINRIIPVGRVVYSITISIEERC